VNAVNSISLAWNIAAEDACLYIAVNEAGTGDVVVFPNPASSRLTIRSGQFAIHTVSIYNLVGELVLDASLPPGNYRDANSLMQIQVDVSSLHPGIYFLKAGTLASSPVTKKIIIQKN
jgi:hypothetical protein